ncbi:MAG: YybH family protein [Gemmatimonadaceae bacterium]
MSERAEGSDGAVRDARVALDQICAMMARSAAAWNRGDLDTFVADYMSGDGTTFIGRRGVVRGPAAIREVYAPRFGPGGVHDSLSFENVEVDLLAPDVANTIAWYVLARGDSVIARGPTSLVMRRVEGRWKIVHDHSS